MPAKTQGIYYHLVINLTQFMDGQQQSDYLVRCSSQRPNAGAGWHFCLELVLVVYKGKRLAFSVENTQQDVQENSLEAPVSPLSRAATPSPRYCPTLPDLWRKATQAIGNWWSVAIIALALVVVTLAYQTRPAYDLKVGGGFDTPYLNLAENGFGPPVRTEKVSNETEGEGSGRGEPDPNSKKLFAPEESSQDYRWTRERPILLFPGIGATLTRLTLQASGSALIAAGQRVEVLVNGQPFSAFDLKPGAPVTRQFDIPAERLSAGSLALEMRVARLGPVNSSLIEQYPGSYVKLDKELYQGQNGFKLYNVRLEGPPGASGFVLPTLSVLVGLVVSAWLLFFGLAYCGVARRVAFGVAALLTLAAGAALAFARLGLTIYTGRLALLLALTVGLLLALDWLIPRLFRHWQLPLPTWAWQGLLVLFLVGMLGRGGGTIYPHTEIIDAPYHVRETKNALADPLKEWGNKELSKVPDQWGSKAIIPYSTMTYLYTAPLAALPIDPHITLNLFNTALDAARVFVIFALAAALGAGARAALVAAGLYLIVPSTWMLNSWGNWPTTMTLWLTTVYLLLVLVYWRNLNRPIVWAGLTAVLLTAMLGYVVTAVFIGMLLYSWAFGLFFLVGRRDKLARRNGTLLFASANVAAGLAIGLYYFQFIPDLMTTLTEFDKSLDTKGSLGGFGNRPFDYYMGLYTNHVFIKYGAGAFIGLAMAVFAWQLFSKQPSNADGDDLDRVEPNPVALRSSSRLWLIGAWLGVFMLFGVAQWKVDMVDKQVWFVLPLAVALSGVALGWLWQRYKTPALLFAGRATVIALVTWTTYSALFLWMERVFIKRR